MDMEELQHHLDFNNIGNAPAPVKIGAIVTLCIAILAAGLWFDTKSQLESLEIIKAEEKTLLAEFKIKANQAAKLNLYKEQLAEMKATFGALLRQLPEKTDVESLIVDVSQTALANGLEVKKFQPSSEIKKSFYAELPIALQVTGTFHELATFISGVAALPRIVTIHNMQLVPVAKKKGDDDFSSPRSGQKLKMTSTAKTYRYLAEDDQ